MNLVNLSSMDIMMMAMSNMPCSKGFQQDTFMITLTLLDRYEKPFLMILVNLSSKDVMMMAISNFNYSKGFMYIYGLRKIRAL